jgi:addiction module HigA family antidote
MGCIDLPPVHPGEILRDLYLEPLGLSSYALAKKLNVPRTRIERVIAKKTGITSDTALRLAKFFRTSPQFWLNLQNSYELKLDGEALKEGLEHIPVCENVAA